MARRRQGALLGLAILVVAVAASVVRGQVHEDRMDPEALGIRDLDTLVVPAARYVGNEVCAECHAGAYQTWIGTKHSRTFVWLESMMARGIAEGAGIEAESPRQSGFCLSCHATAANVAAEWREPGFRMGEGVSCEKCHGPGELHVRAMRDGVPEDRPLRRPGEELCRGCHEFKPSHEAVPTNGKFSFPEYWKKIAHPEKHDE